MQSSTPPRPRRTDAHVILDAAHRISGKVHIWLRRRGIAQDVETVARCYSDDGYAFARKLHECSWPADEELVSLLSLSAKKELDEALTRRTGAWVEDNKIVVPLAIGGRVALPWCPRGRIIDVNHFTATITVHPDAPETDQAQWSGSTDTGWVVGYEVAIPLTGTIGEASA